MVDDKLKGKFNYIEYIFFFRRTYIVYRYLLQFCKNYQVVLLDNHQITMLMHKIEHLSLRLLAVLLIAL